jgi:hypothetical protein
MQKWRNFAQSGHSAWDTHNSVIKMKNVSQKNKYTYIHVLYMCFNLYEMMPWRLGAVDIEFAFRTEGPGSNTAKLRKRFLGKT